MPAARASSSFYEGIYVERELVKSLLEIAKREATKQLSLVTGQIVAKGLKTETVLRVGKPYEHVPKDEKAKPKTVDVKISQLVWNEVNGVLPQDQPWWSAADHQGTRG